MKKELIRIMFNVLKVTHLSSTDIIIKVRGYFVFRVNMSKVVSTSIYVKLII